MLRYPVYLDYSSTTPCDERVLETTLPYFTKFFGNASSRSHAFGWRADTAVEAARKSVASLIGADPKEIVFTSGSTEGCNLALRGVFEMYASKGNHIITTKTEHKAVLDTCKILQKKGAEVTFLNVSKDGIVDTEELKAAIKPETILIAVMYANNETGVVQPVKEIGAIAKQHNILFFSDATQAVGKIPVNVEQDHIDILALSAHKIYGPKGVGALYVRRRNPRVKLAAQITGGAQENNLRSGTLNVPAIVGLGRACEICRAEMPEEAARLNDLRNQLQLELLKIDESYVNGSLEHRLPQICNISFRSLSSSQLLSVLNKTLAVSSGSACTSGSLDPSFVLKAMGIEDGLARGSIRFSIGRFTNREEIDFAITEVKKAVEKLRNESFEWTLFQKGKTR
ncbi:MAG: IscS subfamily cysteine desulfurase [Sphingobacteriales bacterium 41-5]|nr:MAG: IscS subfamily cysteine desulfurase [Sphingobacteriales bacterium 41-5]